jgi:hypothetical protein
MPPPAGEVLWQPAPHAPDTLMPKSNALYTGLHHTVLQLALQNPSTTPCCIERPACSQQSLPSTPCALQLGNYGRFCSDTHPCCACVCFLQYSCSQATAKVQELSHQLQAADERIQQLQRQLSAEVSHAECSHEPTKSSCVGAGA